MTLDINQFANAYAETARDINNATAGGDGYTPPAKGVCMLRYVGYVEVGAQKQKPFKGVPKPDCMVAHHIFELSGANYPVKEFDGVKVPQRITTKTPVKSGEKAQYFKLFKAMNWEGKATHFAQLLGKAFLGEVTWWSFTNDEGKQVDIAQLISQEKGISIKAPIHVANDPITGTSVTTDLTEKVPPQVSALRLFLWDTPQDKIGALWDNIHIPSKEGAERDANVFQNTIKGASNFRGSNIYNYLAAGGHSLDVGEAVNERKATDSGLGEAAEPAAPASAPAAPAPTASADAQANVLSDMGLA